MEIYRKEFKKKVFANNTKNDTISQSRGANESG